MLAHVPDAKIPLFSTTPSCYHPKQQGVLASCLFYAVCDSLSQGWSRTAKLPRRGLKLTGCLGTSKIQRVADAEVELIELERVSLFTPGSHGR